MGPFSGHCEIIDSSKIITTHQAASRSPSAPRRKRSVAAPSPRCRGGSRPVRGPATPADSFGTNIFVAPTKYFYLHDPRGPFSRGDTEHGPALAVYPVSITAWRHYIVNMSLHYNMLELSTNRHEV